MLTEGDLIANRYRIIRLLGKGGMGAVFEVSDERLGRTLALKTLPQSVTDDSSKQRFIREGRALAALSHPNILPIIDFFEDNGDLNLTMPLIEGVTLRHRIAGGPMPLAEVKHIVAAVAEALDYAHRQGIVHRDVKPANIMIDSAGKVLLTDFGIAKFEQDPSAVTHAGFVLGTPTYLAPEALKAGEVDYRVDIYGLAVVTFEMLAGRPPFIGNDLASVLTAQVTQPPPGIRRFRREVPPETEEALAKGLAKDPAQRFSSAALFVEAAFPALPVHPEMTGRDSPRGYVPIEPPHTSQAEPADTSGESTRIFKKVSVDLLRSDSKAPLLPNIAPPPEAGELTRMFATPKASAAPKEIVKPRVSLTFTAVSDPMLAGRSVPIESIPFTIGRSSAANLTIGSEAALSRTHCVIDWQDGAYVLRDLGSTNGVWLNGRPLKSGGSEVLLFGSVIRFSDATSLTFVSTEPSELPDLTGVTIEGRFTLIERLRTSSSTALYKASDLRLPRHLAVKILSPAMASYPEYLRQFHREARSAARIIHPHIAKVVDSGASAVRSSEGSALEIHYICMEFMEGGNLAARTGPGKCQKPAEVTGWLEPIAGALGYAHQSGMVHAGLKTTSIVFDQAGKPYLTDFAIASSLGETARPVFLGTPEMMAPEQWESLEPTPATDQYSLGIITYYALAGVRPYEGQQDPDKRRRNYERGAPPVHLEARHQGNLDVPEAISAVLARAISVKPEDRYASVADFAVAFEKARLQAPAQVAVKEVFFSYRRDAGAGWAALFARELHRLGMSVFVDTERRDNVVRFPAWLEKAITDCDVFVCLLSANTLESSWVRQEIHIAYTCGKPMIPILQEEFKMPDSSASIEPHIEALLSYQGVPLLDRKGVFIDATISELAKMIQRSPKANTQTAG